MAFEADCGSSTVLGTFRVASIIGSSCRENSGYLPRQRSEFRPRPKEEAMSHALATVCHGVAQRAKPEGRE